MFFWKSIERERERERIKLMQVKKKGKTLEAKLPLDAKWINKKSEALKKINKKGEIKQINEYNKIKIDGINPWERIFSLLFLYIPPAQIFEHNSAIKHYFITFFGHK